MTARTVAASRALADMTENDWDAQLFRSPKALAKVLGWQSYHTLRSKGSASGFPDRTLWRDRVLFAELKREKTGPTDRQIDTLNGLAKACAEVYLWRPSDLEEIGRILGTRAVWSAPFLLTALGETWTPGSLWTPNGCRVDELPQDDLVLC